MNARVLGLLLVASLGTLVGGCLGSASAPTAAAPASEPPTQDLAAMRTFVHTPSGQLLGGTGGLPTGLNLHNATGTFFRTRAPANEPTMGVTRSGTLFVTSLGTTGGTHILRSRDKGATWEDTGPFLAVVGGAQVPNSNDPYLTVDRATDRVIKFDMHALACMTLETSDDEGQTWSLPTPACGQPIGGLQDHQSIVAAPPTSGMQPVGYASVLVYCVNRGLQGYVVGGGYCSTSLDGGLSWTPLVPGFPPGVAQCSSLHGHLESDLEGRVFRPGRGCQGPTVFRSQDSGLTWTEHPIPGGSLREWDHEVAVAADEAGGVHAFWIGQDGLPYLASSSDHAETWGPARQVAPPGVTATGSPTISAGASGRVAFAYIGTTADGGYEADESDLSWNGYIGVVLNASSDSPVVATVVVNEPTEPLATGSCGSRGCLGFGDFIDVVIDPEGRPWAAMADSVGGGLGVVATLATGPALRGEPRMLEPLAAPTHD